MTHPPAATVASVTRIGAGTRRPATDQERLVATWTLLLATTQAVQAELADVFTGTGMNAHEFATLQRLAVERDRCLTMSQLATEVGMTTGGVTRCVDRLEAHGLLRRASSRTDRRVIYAVLTPKGLEASRRLGALHRKEIIARLGSVLGDDGLDAMARVCALLAEPPAGRAEDLVL